MSADSKYGDGDNPDVDSAHPDLAPDDPGTAPHVPDDSIFDSNFATSGIAWLLVIAIVILLGVVSWQYKKSIDLQAAEDEEALAIATEAEINIFKNAALTYSVRPNDEYLLDDVVTASTEPLSDSTSSNIAFNAQWVREAGIHLVKAETAYRDNRLSTALEHYQSALKIFPELKELHRYIGLIQVQRKDYLAAVESLSLAVIDPTTKPEIYNNLGVAHLALKQYPAAETALKKAVELNPDYPLAHYNLAAMYYKQKDYAQAAPEYARFLEEHPLHLQAIEAYADCLIELKEWNKATKQLRKIAGERPNDATPHFLLAQTLSMTEEFGEALDMIKHAITLVSSKKSLAWLARDEFDHFRTNKDFIVLFDRLTEELRE